MKKLIILIIFLILPLVNSLTLEQKDSLEKTLNDVNTKSDFEKLMNFLNQKYIDLSNENNILDKINSLATRFDVNLADYPNVKGLDIEIEFSEEIEKSKEKEKLKIKINWIQILPVIFIIIFVLIFEVYRFKSAKEAEEIEAEIPQEEQLKNYIKDAVEKGYTKEEIRNILIEHNWSEEMIDDVLKSF